jgi:hypothetical protein
MSPTTTSASTPPPPEPHNAFYAGVAAIVARQEGIKDSVDGLGTIPQPTDFKPQFDSLGATVSQAVQASAATTGKLLEEQNKALKAQDVHLQRIAEAAHRQAEILATQLVPDRDAPAAWLYAAGVNRDGSFDRASNAGRFLIAACNGVTSLKGLLTGRTKLSRKDFVEKAMGSNERSLVPPDLGEYDFGRFYDLAHRVLKIAEESPASPVPAESPEPPNTSTF